MRHVSLIFFDYLVSYDNMDKFVFGCFYMGRPTGIEPATKGATILCSTNWATAAIRPILSQMRKATYRDLHRKCNTNSLYLLYKTSMKKLWIAVLTIIFFLSSAGFASALGNIRVLPGRVKQYTTDEGSQIWHYQIPKITVIKPKSFDIIFNGIGTNASSVVYSNSYNVAINASYFWWYNDGTYFPAGVWYDNGFLISPQNMAEKDINLQVLAYYNNWQMQFMDNSTVDLSTISQNTPGMYFNAGPWLVKHGSINPDIVKSRSHRQSKTYRTAILRKADNSLYFLIATQKIDLPQFIVFVYKSELVKKWETFDLVNLDGWSSTSLWSPALKFNANKKLPLFIGIN